MYGEGERRTKVRGYECTTELEAAEQMHDTKLPNVRSYICTLVRSR
jgi:hypothetical protein